MPEVMVVLSQYINFNAVAPQKLSAQAWAISHSTYPSNHSVRQCFHRTSRAIFFIVPKWSSGEPFMRHKIPIQCKPIQLNFIIFSICILQVMTNPLQQKISKYKLRLKKNTFLDWRDNCSCATFLGQNTREK